MQSCWRHKNTMNNVQSTTKVRIGDAVMFKAPSGRQYAATVLETDWIGNEVNLLVEFKFTHNNRIIRSTGWQPMSVVKLDDVCPGCGDGNGYIGISGDEARHCPICNPMEGEVVF